MAVDITGSPYYNDYDATKGYNRLLTYPGRAPQSREMNVLQSLFLDLIKRLGDVLMKDGSIVSGCQVSINEAKTQATVSSGRAYINGIIYEIPETVLTISGTGDEVIGIRIDEEVITADDDGSLADPAQTYSNYGQKGADRLKQVPVVVKDDPLAYPVFKMKDGNMLTVVDDSPTVDVLTDVLARRTFDESENYKVRGLEVTVEPFDTEVAQAKVGAGKAYILGYEINKPAPTMVKVPLSKTYRSVEDEPKLYDEEVTDYLLSTPYVRSVEEVVGQTLVVEYLTRGNVLGGMDLLPRTPVFDIVAVNQGGDWNEGSQTFSEGKTFRKGIDYQLFDNSVDWSLAGLPADQPAIGSSYKVAFRYNRHFVQYQDFDLWLNTSNQRHYIRFLASGIKPVDGSIFNVTYTWYLARKDLLYMDKDGNVTVLQGQPDRLNAEKAPETTLYNLPLAYLTMPPNSPNVTVDLVDTTRITMKGIKQIISRINTLEYNLAATDLDNQAENAETLGNLSGILTDGFLGFGRADTNHPSYGVTMNLFTNEIFISADSSLKSLTLNPSLSNVLTKDKFYFAPYSEQNVINQPFASSTMNINPYAVFSTESQISIDPSIDNWIDESTVKLPSTINQTDMVTLPAKFVDSWWTDNVQRYLINVSTDRKQYIGDATKVFEQAATFMRQIPIQITGAKFTPSTDISAKFDGKAINLTPTGSTVAGVKSGTVRVKTDGTFTASLTIPANTPTGTRTISLFNDQNYAERPFTSTGFTKIFVQSETTVVSTVQTFQDIQGSQNRILANAVNEAINKSNQNADAIRQLDVRTQQLIARLGALELGLNKMGGLLDEITRESDNTRKTALQAQYDAQKALSVADAAATKADEATRTAEIAEMVSIAAAQKADLALAVSKTAEADAASAKAKADSVQTLVGQLQTAQTSLYNKTVQLETAIAANQVTNAQAFRAEIDGLKNTMAGLSSQISTEQSLLNQFANKLNYNVDRLTNTINRVDPLAQSFAFRQNTHVSSIEVAFYSKGALPVNVQIRELSAGGQPTTRVVGEKILKPADITTSNNGSVMTKITFDAPILCQADKDYCFVLITEDTAYNVFIGKLGERDLVSNSIMGRQPYDIGVLFSSSNNISWNVHNDTDLKFKINAVSVSNDAVLVFDDIPVTTVSEIVLAVEQLVPESTRIDWEYQVNSSILWNPLPAFEKVTVPQVANNIKLKATVKTSLGSTTSPVIMKNSAVYAMSRKSSAAYVTKNATVDIPYSSVKQIVDMQLPTGTSYSMQFTPDDGYTWITVPQTDVTQVDTKFSRFTHEVDLTLVPPTLTNAKLTPSNSGGTLPNGTYYYVVTAINANGETIGSAQASAVITGGSNSGKVTLDLTGSLPNGATGFKIYRGTSSGVVALKYVYNTIPGDLTTVSDTGTDGQASVATPPTTPTATYTSTMFRGRINLTTTDILTTPKAKRFINIMRV